MGIFGDILSLGVDVAFLPVSIVQDVVEKATGEEDETLGTTKENLRSIKEDLEEIADDI